MKKLHFSEKQKKVFNITVTALQIVVVLLAIIFAAIILCNPNIDSAEVSGSSIKLLPVLSNSMDGDKEDSFKEGDLIVAKIPKDKTALEIGDIVTFKYNVGGANRLNTHRIIEKETTAEGLTVYITQGDAADADQRERIMADEVLAVYDFHIAGLGSAIHWLQNPTNFLLVIVLPLIILFIYNIIMFVRMMIMAKMAKQVEAAAPVDEEEIKRRAIEEYLRAQNGGESTLDGEAGSAESATEVGEDTTLGGSATETAQAEGGSDADDASDTEKKDGTDGAAE